MPVTRTIQTVSPADLKTLIVTCRKCRAEISLPITVENPACQCPGCHTAISLRRPLDAAGAIARLVATPPDDCDVEFGTAPRQEMLS